MKLLLVLWLSFVGFTTYTLFTGLVNGMDALDIAIKRLLGV